MHLPETSNEVSGYDADALAFASASSSCSAFACTVVGQSCCQTSGRVEFDRLNVGIQYKAMPMLDPKSELGILPRLPMPADAVGNKSTYLCIVLYNNLLD